MCSASLLRCLFVCFSFNFCFRLEKKKKIVIYIYLSVRLYFVCISQTRFNSAVQMIKPANSSDSPINMHEVRRERERERKRESQRRLAFLIKLSAALNNDKINSPALLCYSRENVFGVIICISKPIWFFHEHWLTDFRADNFFICRLLKVYSSDTLSDWHYILQDRLLIIA